MWPPPPTLPDRQNDKPYAKRLPAGYRVFIGLCSTLIGTVIGLVGALLAVTEASDGDVLGEAFALIGAAPIGMIFGAVLGAIAALRTSHYLKRSDLGPTARRKKTLLVASLVIGIPSLVVGSFQVAMHHDDPPSDQQMLANFRQHQAIFNQLAWMTQVDKGLDRVGDDWTTPSEPLSIGIPHSRIAQYRKLLSAVGAPSGCGVDAGSVEFYYWGRGSAISSDRDKGYVYTEKTPAPLLPTLNGLHPTGEDMTLAYRHIEGNWYLYYEYIPG